MLMSVTDIEARTGQVYEGAQLAQVEAYVMDVTALVEDFLDISFVSTAPPVAVRAIAVREVMRYLNTDPGVATEHIGDLSTGYAGAGAIEVLAPATEAALRRYRSRLRGRRGIGSIQLVSRYIEPTEEPLPEEPLP
ncbi:hypothetical protein [Nonomuraea jabiensis]|uniref:hypothetical protein n=1 Tax=Nonomuraea jabiensis TaxID=882448 RepID=UPI003D7356E9